MLLSDVSPSVSLHLNENAISSIDLPDTHTVTARFWAVRPPYVPSFGAFTRERAARSFACGAGADFSVSTPFHSPPVLQRSNDGSRTAQFFGGVPARVSWSGILIVFESWKRAAGTTTSREANHGSGPKPSAK